MFPKQVFRHLEAIIIPNKHNQEEAVDKPITQHLSPIAIVDLKCILLGECIREEVHLCSQEEELLIINSPGFVADNLEEKKVKEEVDI